MGQLPSFGCRGGSFRIAVRIPATFPRHVSRTPESRAQGSSDEHGAAHPVFQKLSVHMLKEEQVLFPFLNFMDAAQRSGQPLPAAFFGSVQNPIAAMLTDHNDAGESVAGIANLSGGYRTPPGACPSYIALYMGLAEFERDLHQHVHLENNILFPRALEMEQR
jgi:regulator of cell morphogenesis and NO signaling